MAIHFSPSPDVIACGRSGASLNSSDDQAQVSCKLCLRSLEKSAAPVQTVRKTPSLAELRSAAKAAKAAQVESMIVEKAATSRVAKAAWQQRLEQLPGRNRLPRGQARQGFV